MVVDHYNALSFIIQSAKENKAITPEFIQQINAQVMKQTGTIYQTVLVNSIVQKEFLEKEM